MYLVLKKGIFKIILVVALLATLSGTAYTAPVTISGVPDYKWFYGCGPTAAGDILGYYDIFGYDGLLYDNLAEGDATPTGWGTNHIPEGAKNMMASEGHIADYWGKPDPMAANHTDDSIADFMHTSRDSANNNDGWTWSTRIEPGIELYTSLRGYSFDANPYYWNYWDNDGVGSIWDNAWNLLTTEINNNRPMLFLVDSDGNNSTDHFISVLGYDAETNMYAAYNQWWAGPQWYSFADMDYGSKFGIWGAWTIMPGGGTPVPEPATIFLMISGGIGLLCKRKRVSLSDKTC